MLTSGKAERMDLYRERNTQVLLGKFMSGEISELKPVYDSKVGYRYPIVEAIVGDPAGAEAFLRRLHEAGVLERKLFDKVVFCSRCNSASVSIHYCCPTASRLTFRKAH